MSELYSVNGQSIFLIEKGRVGDRFLIEYGSFPVSAAEDDGKMNMSRMIPRTAEEYQAEFEKLVMKSNADSTPQSDQSV